MVGLCRCYISGHTGSNSNANIGTYVNGNSFTWRNLDCDTDTNRYDRASRNHNDNRNRYACFD